MVDIFADRPLYLITDGGFLRSENRLVEAIADAFKGAPDAFACLQVREQIPSAVGPASDEQLEELLLELSPLCEQFGVKLVCNRRVDLVEDFNLDGVHLGAIPEKVGQTRRVLGEHVLIGYSAHGVEEAQTALSQGANYVFLSPIFDPKSKPAKVPSLGVEPLKELCSLATKPVFALGGIGIENIKQCRDAGATGVAMISSVLAEEKPGEAALQLLDAWRT